MVHFRAWDYLHTKYSDVPNRVYMDEVQEFLKGCLELGSKTKFIGGTLFYPTKFLPAPVYAWDFAKETNMPIPEFKMEYEAKFQPKDRE